MIYQSRWLNRKEVQFSRVRSLFPLCAEETSIFRRGKCLRFERQPSRDVWNTLLKQSIRSPTCASPGASVYAWQSFCRASTAGLITSRGHLNSFSQHLISSEKKVKHLAEVSAHASWLWIERQKYSGAGRQSWTLTHTKALTNQPALGVSGEMLRNVSNYTEDVTCGISAGILLSERP